MVWKYFTVSVVRSSHILVETSVEEVGYRWFIEQNRVVVHTSDEIVDFSVKWQEVFIVLVANSEEVDWMLPEWNSEGFIDQLVANYVIVRFEEQCNDFPEISEIVCQITVIEN